MEIQEADDLRDGELPEDADVPGDGDDDATIPCPACGAQVSELSDHCPSCGHWLLKQEHPKRSHVTAWVILALLAAAALLAWLLLG